MKKKWMLRILLASIFLVAAFSTPAARTEDTPRRIEITAKRFTYSPGELTLRKGQPVILVIRSLDTNHGLRFRDLKVNVKIHSGSVAEVQFTPEKTGDFVGHCSVFCGRGHGSMMLKLHVVD